jgi:hypothetical protein
MTQMRRQQKGRQQSIQWQSLLTVGLLWYPHFKLQYVVPVYPLDWSRERRYSCGDMITFVKAIRSKVFVMTNDLDDNVAVSWIGDMASWMEILHVPEAVWSTKARSE